MLNFATLYSNDSHNNYWKWILRAHSRRRLDMGCHPRSHGFLFAGNVKFSSNISLLTFPPSQKPTSRATISALSSMWALLLVSVQSLFTNWSLLCFPSRGISHLLYNRSRSSSVRREFILLERNSLSCLNALILQLKRSKLNYVEAKQSEMIISSLALTVLCFICEYYDVLLSFLWNAMIYRFIDHFLFKRRFIDHLVF